MASHETPLSFTQSQRAAFERLLTWWDGETSCCIFYGPALAGKSWVCQQLEVSLTSTAQVSRLTVDAALTTAEELLAIRQLHTRLLSHEWSAEDVAAPSAGVNGPRSWLSQIRSELWSPNDGKRLLIVDGIDNLRSWQRVARVLEAGSECRIVLVVTGSESASLEWQERLEWTPSEACRVGLPALSASDASRVGAPPWVSATLGAGNLKQYLGSTVHTPLHLELLALLAEACAPVSAEELALVSGATLHDTDSALSGLRGGALPPNAAPSTGSELDSRLRNELGCGPVDRDASALRWFLRSASFARELRSHYPDQCQRAVGTWALAATRPTANPGTYISRFASVHAAAFDFEKLESFLSLDWYRSRESACDFICDAQRVRDIVEARFVEAVQTSRAATATHLLVHCALAQSAVYDRARARGATRSATDYRREVLDARMDALVRLRLACDSSASAPTGDCELRLAVENGVRGVEALLRARRRHCTGLQIRGSRVLIDVLENDRPWSDLSALSAVELSFAEESDLELLAHANSRACEALGLGLVGQLLPFAERLVSLTVDDWVAGVLELQRLPSHEAFDACLKLQIPAAWSRATELAHGVLAQCETINDPTLRLLVVRSLLPVLTPPARATANELALELWTEHAQQVESYPEVASSILAELDVDGLKALARGGSSSIRSGIIRPMLSRGEIDVALELAESLSSDRRLSLVARVALWCKLHAPQRWLQLRARVERLLAAPGEGTFALITDPEVGEFGFDVERLTIVATSYGSYHGVVALARLIRNVPAAQTPGAIAQLLMLMAEEEDTAALGEVVACARWLAPADAAALFVAYLNHGWMHESGLVGMLTDVVGIGALAPLIATANGDAAEATARLVCDSAWLSALE